jgi:hypothetical protein
MGEDKIFFVICGQQALIKREMSIQPLSKVTNVESILIKTSWNTYGKIKFLS